MQKIMNFSNGDRAVLSASDVSAGMLNKTDEKLQLAGAELLRMEDEGGIALTKKQKSEISAYAKARQRIKALLFVNGRRQPDLEVTQE